MNDRQEILEIFRGYYNANVSFLIVFARRFVSAELAKDIIHDAFLEVWEMLDISVELPSRAYLFRMVRNKCLNTLKREEVQDNYIHHVQAEYLRMGLDYYDSLEKLLIDREGIQELYHQIELLPKKCKQIFKMAYFEEKKSIEIATILGLSVRTVEHQLYLGLKTLREKLHPNKKNKRKFLFFF